MEIIITTYDADNAVVSVEVENATVINSAEELDAFFNNAAVSATNEGNN